MIQILLLVAHLNGLPGDTMIGLCTVESNLDPNAINHADGGSPSYGLCQVKKNTCGFVGMRLNKDELMNPTLNATCAAKYLKYQLKRYKGNMEHALVAYNAGRLINNRKYAIKVNRHARRFKEATASLPNVLSAR